MASSRGNPDPGDIFRSIAVLGIIVLALYGLGQFFTSTPDQVTASVDWKPAAESAQRSADYTVLAPDELPDGWHATSARYDPTTGRWKLGILDGDEEYLGIDQSTDSVKAVLKRLADGSEPAGSAKVGDRVWSVNTGPDDRITYVNDDGGITSAVTGTVEQDELEAYIDSLG